MIAGNNNNDDYNVIIVKIHLTNSKKNLITLKLLILNCFQNVLKTKICAQKDYFLIENHQEDDNYVIKTSLRV